MRVGTPSGVLASFSRAFRPLIAKTAMNGAQAELVWFPGLPKQGTGGTALHGYIVRLLLLGGLTGNDHA
jgi:hypothetical protein